MVVLVIKKWVVMIVMEEIASVMHILRVRRRNEMIQEFCYKCNKYGLCSISVMNANKIDNCQYFREARK